MWTISNEITYGIFGHIGQPKRPDLIYCATLLALKYVTPFDTVNVVKNNYKCKL